MSSLGLEDGNGNKTAMISNVKIVSRDNCLDAEKGKDDYKHSS